MILRYMGYVLFRFLSGLLINLRLYSQINLKPIDLADVFPADMDDLLRTENNNFRLLSSIEDYNREIVYLFQAHGDAFYVDRSHTDGHFRV